MRQRSIMFGYEVHCRLVRLYQRQGVSCAYGGTAVDLPRQERRGLGIRCDFRHTDNTGHYAAPFCCMTQRNPSMTSSVRAAAARSSTLEILGAASPPVTRCTG